jgi:Uma2 family endonuclease
MENNVFSETKTQFTPEQYLELERKAETKSEYLNGEIFPMPGVSRAHSLIVGNLTLELGTQFMDRPCERHGPDMRVKVPATGLYTYPDIAALCGEPRFEDRHVDTLLNPQLIIEVLSESTESYDRGRKFAHYRSIESLLEYVLVSQEECRVEQYVRQDDGKWLYTETTDPNALVELASVACRLSLSRLYRRVDFTSVR